MTNSLMNNTQKNAVANAVKKNTPHCKASKRRMREYFLEPNYEGFGYNDNELYYNGHYLYF